MWFMIKRMEKIIYVTKKWVPFSISAYVYSRSHHEDRDRYTAPERLTKKNSFPHLEQHLLPDWLLQSIDEKYQYHGVKPILIIDKVSQNTVKQSRIFSAIIGLSNLIDNRTKDDSHRIFNENLDVDLRREAVRASIPIFVMLQKALPDVAEMLATCDGQLMHVEYNGKSVCFSWGTHSHDIPVQVIFHEEG